MKLMCCCLIVLVLSIGYHCYQVKISNQILNQEKVLEIFLRNSSLSQLGLFYGNIKRLESIKKKKAGIGKRISI